MMTAECGHPRRGSQLEPVHLKTGRWFLNNAWDPVPCRCSRVQTSDREPPFTTKHP
uniref:Uncharacterized protein n=1 Tax=Arundo donax TaxID=35708 RepID=A0A0A8Z2F0_ARUDO